MELKYTLTEQDYINFNLFHIQNSKMATKALKIQRYTIPVLYLVLAYIFATIGDSSYILSFIIFSIFGILWFVLYPKFYYRTVIRNVKKMMKEGRNEGLLGEHHMLLTSEGIVDNNTTGETKVAWSGIQEVKEDKNYLYLYNSSVSAYILPKREITNLEELKSYIKNHL